MKAGDLLRMAARNAFRSKLRTTLTVLSLFVGAFTLTLTTALGAGVNDYVERQVATLSSGDVLLVSAAATTGPDDGPAVYDPNGRQSGSGTPGPLATDALLNQADLDAIAAIDGVERVDPVSQVVADWISTDAADDDARYVLQINPTSSIGRSDLVAGDQLDQTTDADQIVLPEDYVAPLGFADAADAVGSTVTIGYSDATQQPQQIEATIAGVARESLFASGAGANTALTDVISQAQKAPGAPDAYPLAVAELQTGDDGTVDPAAVQRVKDALAADDLAGQTVEDQLGVVQTVINGIIGVLSAFAVVALIAASFGIVNTLLMSVQERTREIGLMKAVGMSNGRVFALFSLEALVIGFLGAGIGALAAVGVGSAIAAAAADTLLSGLPGLTILLFQPLTIVTVIAVIMLVAFLSGVLPARRAARQDPIESLRYE
ncbi:ABC transporter permease [Microbacterium sp. 10M-3C3]|jgi:putative ABC transport system permease protein|uniref:ABC transporter permease n=1 Tax=Microbacterium sp. 10M-3C3 TaxID=2483401 RepID=UPI000F63A4F3|nr:ABC transporter permease [Microbacterium sp. 10M-3C3]